MTEKVLIVDDDQEFIDLLSERLILRGLEYKLPRVPLQHSLDYRTTLST